MQAAEILEDRTLLAAFSVDTTDDTVDATPGDGFALDALGNTSLRAAIMEANALAGDDTINLPVGTYALTIANAPGQENAGAAGDLDITDVLTIVGGTANSDDTRIDGAGLAGLDRVFHVMGGTTVEFRNLTIENGSAVDDGTAENLPGIHGHGGGVLVVESSTATFDNVNVANNVSSSSGGGIYNDLSTVNITNGSSVNTNEAAAGGGIYAVGESLFATTTIEDSEVTNNVANAPDQFTMALGGGIYNQGDVIHIINSQITNNRALGFGFGNSGSNTNVGAFDGVSGSSARGGGIYMGVVPSGEVHITSGSLIGDNSAIGGDGFAGEAGIDGSTEGRTSGESGGIGGNGGNAYGGGMYADTGLVDVRDSTFTGNAAASGFGGQGGDGGDTPFDGVGGTGGTGGIGGEARGGGIGIGGGGSVDVDIDNSVFGMNSANGGGGGQGGSGGGARTGRTLGFAGAGGQGGNGGATSGGAIYTNSGTLDITNTIFTNGNSATGGFGGNGGHGQDGPSGFVRGGHGGRGGNGGNALGGAVGIGASASGPFVSVGQSTITGNSAVSGNGGNGGGGGGNTSGGSAGNGGSGGMAGSTAGGGLFTDSGTIDITDSTFDQNTANSGDGGDGGFGGSAGVFGGSGSGGTGGEGGEAGGGGIGANSQNPSLISAVEVRRSTLSANQANGGNGGNGGSSISFGGGGGPGGEAAGGGVFVELVLLSLINTTVSGNSATGGNGGNGGGGGRLHGVGGVGGSVGGGGVDADDASAGSALNNSTITLNDNAVGDGGFGDSGQAASGDDSATGLAVFTTTLTMNNTIVAQNVDDFDLTGTVTGEGNFIGNGNGAAGITDGVDGNDVGTTGFPLDAELNPLASNGGPTQTHLPGHTSPVIDNGVDSAVPASVTTDQRGFARIEPSVVDVGAVEVKTDTGPLNKGIAVLDNATGTGYVMRSVENVHTRFAGDSIHPGNSDHLIAVQFTDGQWYLNNNAAWIAFTPLVTDRLLASLDFDHDTISGLQGVGGKVNGIDQGYLGGDLVFLANNWEGVANLGEFQITGKQFELPYVNIGDTNHGVAVHDTATGTGFVMFSPENVHNRFAGDSIISTNSDHLIAVQFTAGQWFFNNNSAWIAFAPAIGDHLIASLDFDTDTIGGLQGVFGRVNGISQGYFSSDLTFFANQFDGVANAGEFQISGTQFELPQPDGPDGIYTGQLNRGVAAHESATGSGYIMFSAETVHSRFAGNSIVSTNSDHLIAVQNTGGQWFFSNNAEWIPFTSTTNDRLLASVDFVNDTVTGLEGSGDIIEGIDLGYVSGDLLFFADQFDGSFNDGEFQVTGTHFEHPPRVLVGDIDYGIAVADNAADTGYIMYSRDAVQSRLASILPGSSDHLIAVRHFGGQWQMNDNSLTWFDFTPAPNDRLLASIDFSADTITSLQGSTGTVNGIDQGYDSGDLTFAANLWAGAANAGEFTVGGTYFEVDGIASGPIAPAVFDQAPAFTFDADGDGQVQALSDGIPFVRFMAGFTDESFAWGASERDLYMDFDGNGKVEPLTDGILLVRFMAGFRGQSLIEGAVASNAIRTDSASITAWLSQFVVTETSQPTDESTTVLAASLNSAPLTPNGEASSQTGSQSNGLTFAPDEDEDEVPAPVAPRRIETAATDEQSPIVRVTNDDLDGVFANVLNIAF